MALSAEEQEIASDIRTLIPDTDAIYGAGADEYLFTDEQIMRFYRVGASSVLRAAGLAMIAVGNSEAMISKVIVTQDLETDGAKAQKEWREAGRLMLVQANAENIFSGFELIDYKKGWSEFPPELTEAPWDGSWPYGYGN